MTDTHKPVPKELAPASANTMVEQEAAVIFDVREPHEFAEEHIVGAQSLPLSVLDPKQLTPGKSAMLSGWAGRRSCGVAAQLRQAGFDNVADHRGGIVGWKQAGLPTDGENPR